MRANSLPCRCTVLGYRGFLKSNFPKVVRVLARYIEQNRIDILQTFFEDSIFVGYFAAMLSKARPVLVSSRRDIGLGSSNQPWYHSLYRQALPWVNRSFDGVLANSQEVKRHVALTEKTPAGKITVIYNGVAIPAAACHARPAVFSSNHADCWIGLLASLTPVKRHDLLLRAFCKTVAEVRVSCRLLLLGEGEQRPYLEQLAESLGILDLVHFEGAVANVDAYLEHLHVGVLCSDREGLSNAILEYMVHGLPVIATEVGGNVELVTRDNGLCVPVDDADALSDALTLLVTREDLRRQLGAASREKAHRLFSWQQSIKALEEYYESLLEQRR